MESNIWDMEYQELAQKVSSLENTFSEGNEELSRAAAKKLRIINQIEAYLDKVNTRFKRLGQVTLSSSKRLRALVYWAGELSHLGLSLVKNYDLYLKQFMWIQLFKTRFLGDSPDHETYLIAEHELDAMSEKHTSLKTMESYLHKQNFKLRQAETKLRATYNQLKTEEENFLAGRSLQKQWGFGAAKAQRNPVLGEIEKLLYGIGFQANPKIKEATQLKMLSTDFNKKSKVIMDECRTLMEHNDRLSDPEFNPTKVREIKKSLKNIRHLESAVSSLADKAMPLGRERSPILLKKKTI